MTRFAFAALLLLGCGAPVDADGPAVAPPVHLDVVSPEARMPTATGTSELLPLRRAMLSVEAPGRVLALEIERGQRVEAGQVLLRLDVGRTAVAASAARATIEQAQASLAQAERSRALAERLAASGSGSRRSVEQAEDAASISRAALSAAEAQARVTRRGLTEAVLRAPFSGTIVERHVEVGEYLAPGTAVALLMDTTSLRADVLLDPRESLDVRPGAAVAARVFARPDERFEGVVLRVGEAVDSPTRRLPVEVEINDPERRLRPGLVARFEVVTGESVEMLSVDSDAVFERFELTQVFVVDGQGVAHRRTVTLGAVRGGRAQVLEGLEAGERVVAQGQDRVLDGQPVRAIERAAPGEAHAERSDG